MNFSTEWDLQYRNNTNMSIWPWSDLVSCIMRYARPNKQDFRVLELGCGAGANIPFFESLKIEYFAIEGSSAIVNGLKQRFPQLVENIAVGDFTESIPFENKFDLIVDRSSITHNTKRAIKQCLNLIYEKLNVGGKYVGIDWFSTLHSEYQNGIMDEDEFTRTKYTSGQFANVGRVHFSDYKHILELFHAFNITLLDHKIIKTQIPENNKTFASWNIIAEKK